MSQHEDIVEAINKLEVSKPVKTGKSDEAYIKEDCYTMQDFAKMIKRGDLGTGFAPDSSEERKVIGQRLVLKLKNPSGDIRVVRPLIKRYEGKVFIVKRSIDYIINSYARKDGRIDSTTLEELDQMFANES